MGVDIDVNNEPAAIVTAFENSARLIKTPCGEGAVFWRSWGKGPPLILMHGSHGSWSHWIRNLDALAEHYTVWAVDLPGFGESDAPPASTHDAISEVLAAGIRELPGIDGPVDIVGFSFGGVVAAFLSVAHPALVRRIVLVDTGGLGTPMGKPDLTRVRGLEGAERKAAHRHNLLGLMLHHRESADELAIHLQELNGMRGRLNPAELVLPDKLLGFLQKTTVPFDAIWGEHDIPHPDPSAQAKVLREIQPELAFRVIADAGHWVMYEQPEAFNSSIVELLSLPPRHAASHRG